MGPNGRGRRRSPTDSARIDAPGPDGHEEGHPGTEPAIVVRPGTQADAITAATLHAEQISEGFLAFLGPRFLERLYRRISRTPHSFLLIAHRQDVPIGFIAGSTNVSGLYKSFLWHDGVGATLGAAGRLARGWRRVLETLRHGASGDDGVGRGGELLAIAVEPAWQGHGAGGLLVASFLDELGSRACAAAHVVVGADNGGAIALYERAGFVVADRFELHRGTRSVLMQWDRHSPPPHIAST